MQRVRRLAAPEPTTPIEIAAMEARLRTLEPPAMSNAKVCPSVPSTAATEKFRTRSDVFQHLNDKVQVCLFSATMPEEILAMTHQFMRSPIRILVKRDELTLEGICFLSLINPETEVLSL